MLDLQKFMKQYNNVVTWNGVARNGVHDFSDDSISRQTEYTRSEIKETAKGITESDSVEVLDGVADVFVTMMYKHYLTSNGVVFEEDIERCIKFMASEGVITFESDHDLAKEHLLDILKLVELENESSVFDTSSLCPLIELMGLTETYYQVDILEVIEHVMDSNWSKFPDVNATCIDEEVEYISNKMTDFKDIVGTVNEEHGVVVYRTDNGVGKIMKPSTFWNADCARFL